MPTWSWVVFLCLTFQVAHSRVPEVHYPPEMQPNSTHEFYCTMVEQGVMECSINGEVKEFENAEERVFEFGSTAFLLDALGVGLLTLTAGLMSGMTIGLMGLDLTTLEILSKSGTETQQQQAKRVLPLLQKHHWLLCTLLLMNAAVNEALPILLERLVNPVIAVAVGVTLILLFGEIIPQALCSRWALPIGSNLSWLMWFLIAVCSPIAWPISKLLDYLIGTHEGIRVFKRTELKELVTLHGIQNFLNPQDMDNESTQQHHPDALSIDEINIIKGALDLKHKTVLHKITPLQDCFSLSTEDVLDHKLLCKILDVDHSRIPVYKQTRDNIVGMLIVKNLIDIPRDVPTRVSDLPIEPVPTVPASLELYHLLNIFQTGSCHMAIIVDDNDHFNPLGLITLDDVIQELIQHDIEDETDKKHFGEVEEEDTEFSFTLHRGVELEADDISIEMSSFDDSSLTVPKKRRKTSFGRKSAENAVSPSRRRSRDPEKYHTK
eukprot:TRINITY_DN12029_c0_g1_i1.p1 TRINITY_DN12029_c0_g1~~TRINITY_DN12029_c0_g1_i1.p1  ORF type:complete len:492 (-),score=63.28 TRINITY_DN12029_c0_g1_i1:85-1560(-)